MLRENAGWSAVKFLLMVGPAQRSHLRDFGGINRRVQTEQLV